jgi:hypothetical protein
VTATAAEVRRRPLARLGFTRRGGGCGVDGTKGAGRRLYRATEGPWRAGPGRRAGGGCAAAGLGLESEPSSSLRTGPTGGSRLAVRERKRRRGRSGLGWERGSWAVWAAWGRKKRKGQLGWALREKGERRRKERESGSDQKRKREREKEMHLNAFEFEFEFEI